MKRWMLVLPLLAASRQDPQTEYKDRLAKVRQEVAAGHANVGATLSDKKMHQWAKEEYNRAIALDPDCVKAREKLGFKKVDGNWEQDPDKEVPSGNKLSGKDADRVRKEYDKQLLDKGKDFAKKFVELASWCAKNGLKDEAAANHKSAVEYDPDNATARKALGYEKEKNGPWLSADERKFRKEMKEGLAKAPKGKPSTAPLAIEIGTLTKQEHDHFIAASPHLDKAKLEGLIQHAEHAYAMWHKIFKKDNVFGDQKMQFLILKDKSQHESYIDKTEQGDSAHKELAKKSAGQLGFPLTECYQGDREIGSIEDYVIHATIQILQNHLCVGRATKEHNPIWLTEGMAYYFTRAIKETAAWG